MNDTPTPRTDEIAKHLDEALNLDSAVDFVVFADKLQDLCRQLERELGQMDKSYQGARSRENDKMDRIKTLERELAEAKADISRLKKEIEELTCNRPDDI